MLRALDLFCGAGGATKGLQRAGFHVTGIDLARSKNYCGDEFFQKDALAVLKAFSHFGATPYDLIWASPVCKRYSVASRIHGNSDSHPDQVGSVRELLQRLKTPWVIENVQGAPLLSPAMLCGTMFGLRVYRHRLFESSFPVSAPPHSKHEGSTGAHRGYSRGQPYVCVAGHNFDVAEGRQAMGIDWMTRDELSQAIPPAFSEYIARQWLAQRKAA